MDVVGPDDFCGGFLANIPKGVRFIEGSVNDDSMVRMLTENEQFDFIYHVGTYYATEGLSHFIRLLTTKLAEEGKRTRGVW
jgi:UDP-glucose 4-epimerase